MPIRFAGWASSDRIDATPLVPCLTNGPNPRFISRPAAVIEVTFAGNDIVILVTASDPHAANSGDETIFASAFRLLLLVTSSHGLGV